MNKELSEPSWYYLNEKFEDFYKKKKYEQDWYKILGVNSFREIAKDVGRTAEYRIIYISGSEVMHGSTYSGQLAFDDSKKIIYPMRSPEEIGFPLRLAMALTLKMVRSTLEYYRPAEVENLKRKYREDWASPLRRIPDIRVEEFTVSLE